MSSLKHDISIRNLEARMDALEERVARVELGAPGYRPRHRGFGKWQVVDTDLRPVDGLICDSREDAEAAAAEMNGEGHA